MRKAIILSSLFGLSCLISCSRHPFPDDAAIVDQTYIHRYGCEVPSAQWNEGGQDGQVVTKLSNGVTVTSNYEAGVLSGETTTTHPYSDVVQKRQTYSEGNLTKEVVHNVNGVPMKETIVSQGDQKSITNWYDDGTPQSKEEYEGDSLISGEYFNRSNQVETRVEQGEGEKTNRDTYGQLESIEKISDGKVISRTIFHTNGHPKDVIPFNKKGVIEGERRTFLPGGEPATVETWVKGTQHGLTIVFQNGIKFAEVMYQKGKKNGVEKRYKDGSQLVTEITWADDMRNGPTTSYIGSQPKTEWFYKDQPVTEAVWLRNNPTKR